MPSDKPTTDQRVADDFSSKQTASNYPAALAEALQECERLRAENAKLHALLAEHGIAANPEESPRPDLSAPAEAGATTGTALNATSSKNLTPSKKVALFRRLFRGRTDVYPIRWENKAGKSGYAPACGNEWRAGVCEKPKSNVRIAATACCCPSPTRLFTII